ncbi:hypothetical protein D3C74_319620 [compost metagenome]
MIQLAELAVLNHFFDAVHAFVIPVDYPDIQNFARLMLNLLHLQGFCVSAGCRFFAQDMLACPQAFHGDGSV